MSPNISNKLINEVKLQTYVSKDFDMKLDPSFSHQKMLVTFGENLVVS